jgi:Uma2 family endonuclease
MTTITLAPTPRPKRKSEPKPRHQGKKMTLAMFKNWKAEDGFKYEWDNGIVIGETPKMKNTERMIVVRLTDKFTQTQAHTESGRLLPETEIFLASLNKSRVPDLSFFTKAELEASAKGGEPIPAFAIEIVSETDRIGYYQEKMKECFTCGVKTVWMIFSDEKQVWIFTSPKDVRICTDDDVCSAAPAIADFTITPNELFK